MSKTTSDTAASSSASEPDTGLPCPHCGETDPDHFRAAFTAAALHGEPNTGLDVERLARALAIGDPDIRGYLPEARRIAREYAASEAASGSGATEP